MNTRITRLAVALMWASLAAAMGCAGYAGDVKEVRTALRAGNKPLALSKVNAAMEVKEPDQYPLKVKSKTSLLLMERAAIQQGMNEFVSSSLDYRVADQNMELLDVKNNAVGEISKWIFSGNAGIYRAPVHEKLLLSTSNMLNYLALGQLESARVEARRLEITQQYLRDTESEEIARLGIGDYLSGFTFEMSGRYEQAIQQYSEALAAAPYPTAVEAMKNIAGCTSYRSEQLDRILAETPAPDGEEALPLTCQQPDRETGTLLVIASTGLAPHKKAHRLPIGAAIVLAGAYLAPAEVSRANGFAVKGLLKWVNFTELVQSTPKFNSVDVTVDGKVAGVGLGEDVSLAVRRSWDEVKGKLMAAAIVRMIARAAAGAGTNAAVKQASGDGLLGLLAQVVVEGTMTAADTPDTRCWNTLPAAYHISRLELPAGVHNVEVRFTGSGGTETVKKKLTIAPGGFNVLPVHTMR